MNRHKNDRAKNSNVRRLFSSTNLSLYIYTNTRKFSHHFYTKFSTEGMFTLSSPTVRCLASSYTGISNMFFDPTQGFMTREWNYSLICHLTRTWTFFLGYDMLSLSSPTLPCFFKLLNFFNRFFPVQYFFGSEHFILYKRFCLF